MADATWTLDDTTWTLDDTENHTWDGWAYAPDYWPWLRIVVPADPSSILVPEGVTNIIIPTGLEE